MLPARTRMRRGAEFATTVRRGRRGGTRAVVVHVHSPDEAPDIVAPGATVTSGTAEADLRVGFVVSRAVGPAVVRNRVRRRLRHLLRSRLDTLPAGRIVVRANPAAADMSSAALGRDLDAALGRALASTGARS